MLTYLKTNLTLTSLPTGLPPGIFRVTGDRYAGDWPAEQFRKNGIHFESRRQARLTGDAVAASIRGPSISWTTPGYARRPGGQALPPTCPRIQLGPLVGARETGQALGLRPFLLGALAALTSDCLSSPCSCLMPVAYMGFACRCIARWAQPGAAALTNDEVAPGPPLHGCNPQPNPAAFSLCHRSVTAQQLAGGVL